MTAEHILVTGGTGGLGSAVCEQLATEGFRPIVGYASNADRAQEIADRTDGVPLHVDLSAPDSRAAAIERLRSVAEDLVGVVLAGSPAPVLGRFGRIDMRDLQLHLEVSACGTQELLAGVVRGCFRKRKRGVVVGVLSDAMGHPGKTMPEMGAYTIGKFAMQGTLAMLAADYSWLSVRTLRPGFSETPMLQVFDERFLKPLRDRGEVSDPAAVADEVLALVRDGLEAPSRASAQ